MDWQSQVITLYLTVCDRYRQEFWVHVHRFASHADLRFTDEEVITLFTSLALSITSTRIRRSMIMPTAMGGIGFLVCRAMQRLNRTTEVFPALLDKLSPAGAPAGSTGVADSFPVVLAQQSRRFNAKVAHEVANSGYCPSKKLYYPGVKVHVIGDDRPGTLPLPRYLGMSPASLNDGPILEQVASMLAYQTVFADKAYEYLSRQTSLPFTVFTPIRKAARQTHLDAADRLLSAAVSRVRQPIEALFHWIDEKTGIEAASQVRSSRGLLATSSVAWPPLCSC